MKRPRTYLIRFAQLVVLLCWVLGYWWLLRDDRYQSFLSVRMRPMLVLATSLLVLFLLAVLMRRGSAGATDSPARTCAHAAVLLVPLLYMVPVQGQQLGSYTASQRNFAQATMPEQPGSSAGPVSSRPPGGSLTIAELLSDFQRQRGHTVITEGMAYQSAKLPPGHFVLMRFMVWCCAADARPIGVVVASADADSFENDTWVRVEGEAVAECVDGRDLPCIRAVHIEKIERPKMPYLWPF